MRAEQYFSVDIEADGPIPGPYSMVSIGLCVAGRLEEGRFIATPPDAVTFYRELRPISDEYVPEALAVSGLDRAALMGNGADPAQAMADLSAWVTAMAGLAKPIVVAYPACYDWMFLYWYLMRFTGRSVFGHSGCLDMKTLYAAKAAVPMGAAVKGRMPEHLLSTRRHSHHALGDAIEQAELFVNLMGWSGAMSG